MRKLGITLTLVLACSGLALGQSQASSNQSPSLGDLAKQLKAQRAKEAAKPKVFTNDNLPARPPEEKLSVAAGMSTTSGAGEKGGAKSEPTPGSKAAEEDTHSEKYYRTRAGEIRAQMELHQRELNVLEQKLSQGQVQFYSDPNKTLQQSSTPDVNSDVNKLRDSIAKKKQDIADDQKGMDDLRDRLRQDGGNPGWIR